MAFASRRERGVSLIELMTALAMMIVVSAAALMMVSAGARSGRSAQERSDMQRAGRAALDLMSNELSQAGLGLPSALAFASFSTTPAAGDGCPGTPELRFASVDFQYQWIVQQPIADRLITIKPTPVPATARDIALVAGDWVYLYINSTLDPAGGFSGNALLRVGANRDINGTNVSIDSANYSAQQPTFVFLQNFSTTRDMVLLRARVSTFGALCPAGGEPYIYWTLNGQTAPVASNVDTTELAADDPSIDAKKKDVVGLRFRFLVDDNRDGNPDDQNGDGTIDRRDLVPVPANLDTLVAVEIQVRIRSADIDKGTGQYKTLDFSQLVPLSNMHTDNSQGFIFVDNRGL